MITSLDGNESSFTPGEQDDLSIVDVYGNKISYEDRLNIIETVSTLPVALFKSQIVDTILNNKVSIIRAETGAGKTTQVAKYMYQEGYRVVNTVPRVISAVSLGQRVSEELICETGDPKNSLGLNVGFRTGEKVSSKSTSPLSFHTDGTELMRRSSFNDNKTDILILDEIHQFSIPSEILSMVIKKSMLKTKNDTRIVLMSATIDPSIFQDFFKDLQNDIPVTDIPGRTFPINEYYNDGKNYIGTTLGHLKQGENILLFSKGKKEIQEIVEKLKQSITSFELDGERFQVEIMPLHSELPIEYQTSLLQNPPDGVKRIIVSTNVAEESITIPYINTVVDLGKGKVSICNEYGIPTLVTYDISKANSKQRKGRGGRVMEGNYIRENETPYDELDEYPKAPIEREMIDREILACLKIGIDVINEVKNLKKEGKKLFFHDVP
ncbi:MAG: helicase-related protein, partial [Candidatus Gracilibacteria bacterium]|nr:helicase-related protein [Candidatus Gracilibacteria bacterium]